MIIKEEIIAKDKSSTFTLFSSIVYFSVLLVLYFLTKSSIKDDVLYYYCIMTASLAVISISTKVVGNKRVIFIFGVLLLGYTFAFRGIIGIDDISYQIYFNEAGRTSLLNYLKNNSIEKGYLLLNYLLYRLCFGNYDLAKIFISYIPFVFFGKAIWKNRFDYSPAVSALILWTHYYCLTMGNGLVRLFIAVSICFYSLDSLVEKNRLRFTIYIIIASLFHVSSLFMLFLLIMTINREWFLNHWKSFTLLMVIVLPISFIIIARYIVPKLDIRYLGYGQVGTFSLSVSSFDVLPVLILGIIGFKHIDQECRTRYIIGLVLCFMSILISVCSTIVPMSRLIFFGNLGILILMSGIQQSKSKTISKYIVLGTLIAYAIIYMHVTGLWNARIEPNILPYRAFWNN